MSAADPIELLTECIEDAARNLLAAQEPMLANSVAKLAWVSFRLRASGNNGGLTQKIALEKARGLVRKINNGRIKYDHESRTIGPTYPSKEAPLGKSREEIKQEFMAFVAKAVIRERYIKTDDAPVSAHRVTTGVGKTRMIAEVVAHSVRQRGNEAPKSWVFFVPTHRLGEEIVEEFSRQGIYAQVFRGRAASVGPDKSGPKMCDNLEQVNMAIKCHASVSTSCCKLDNAMCKHFDVCRYQAQLKKRPQVWVCAHEMLFYPQEEIGEVGGVVIDESFWSAGVKLGVSADLSDLPTSPIGEQGREAEFAALHEHRGLMTSVLSKQKENRGVSCRTLVGSNGRTLPTGEVTSALGPTHEEASKKCSDAIKLEWELLPDPNIRPGMARAEWGRATGVRADIARGRRMIGIWGTARETINGQQYISGRLALAIDDETGERIVKIGILKPIHKQWRDAPTLILDATLPDSEILKAFYPNVVIGVDIEAEMQHTHVRQIVHSPTSATKLESDANKTAVKRHILERWMELGRQKTLVVCQQKYEAWLRGVGLPGSICIEHFNNIEGVDSYGDVRLLVLVGRAIPGPIVAEDYAGVLSGKEPLRLAPGAKWYPTTLRAIRMRDGAGVGINCDYHPDPVVESVRWQLHEAKAMQAVGRARAVNRTEATPLDIDILADVVLPLTVDQVLPWSDDLLVVEMAVEGIILTSATDMSKAWPHIWATPKNAERAASALVRKLIGLCVRDRADVPHKVLKNNYSRGLCGTLSYQPAGTKQRWRSAHYDPAVLPDPRQWLERRLGPLAGFKIAAN